MYLAISGAFLGTDRAMYVKRLSTLGPCARIVLFRVSEEFSFLNSMLTFDPVIRPTERRFALSFGAYMTSVSMIGMSGRSNDGSDTIAILMVPLLFAVNDSPLAVSMTTGGMSYRSWNSSKLPDRWLDAAESMSHMWVPCSGDASAAMCVDVLILDVGSCIVAILTISVVVPLVWIIGVGEGLVNAATCWLVSGVRPELFCGAMLLRIDCPFLVIHGA